MKKVRIVILLLSVSLLLDGCFIFRGKNRCDSCPHMSKNKRKKHGGFYLGSVGGPAARLARDCIRKVEVLEYPELGMEAVWRIEVENFPAFIVMDDKGNDFYEGLE